MTATATKTAAQIVKGLNASLKRLEKKDPTRFEELVAKLARLDDEYATESTPQAQPAPVKSADATTLPSSHFKYDKAKDNWKLKEDVQFAPPDTTNFSLTGVAFLRDGESYTGGEEMVRRDRSEFKCNLGQAAAEWLLENPHLIPIDLRGKALVFTGTIWQCPGGGRRVVYLYWRDVRWILHFRWLDSDWDGRSVLARLSGSTSA